MSETKPQSVTFEQVQKVASQMLSQGVKPTVRNIRAIVGGRNETVAEYFNDFNKKRDAEVSKLADEIGSSEVGKLIAGEIQTVVDRRTSDLNEILARQELQIEEFIEILKDNEKECSERVKSAEEESVRAIAEANIKIEKSLEKANRADEERNQAQADLSKALSENKSAIEAVQAEAQALVKAANKHTEKAETETAALREQVKLLSIDVATHDLMKEQFVQANTQLEAMRNQLADSKTEYVRIESQKSSFERDNTRIEKDLIEAKEQAKQLPIAQTQLVELQKQVSQLQGDLATSDREKDSLSRALAVSDNNNSK